MLLQTVVVGVPPLFDAIDAVFHVRGKSVVFAWGDKIFNPYGAELGAEIIAHEGVHGERQLDMGVERWWANYMLSRQFRFDEELPAHRAEFNTLMLTRARNFRTPRIARRALATHVAKKLSARLYGSLVPLEVARELILEDRNPFTPKPDHLH